MLKRILFSAVIAGAIFGAMTSGMLARHGELRRTAVELLRLDIDILIGG